MTRLSVLAAPVVLVLVGCGVDKPTAPQPSAALTSSAVAAGLAPSASPFYQQHNLVSDVPGQSDFLDPSLVNAWGLAASSGSPWWVSDNGTGRSTLYNGNTGVKQALTVSVPTRPTGVVFNTGTGFVVASGSASGRALFLFATEDGTIAGWNPGVPAAGSTDAQVGVDNSSSGAIYKGLAIATTAAGDRLYATNFHAGTVDVFDGQFHAVTPPGAFADPDLPARYAPFGIRSLGGLIYVTYALQDDNAEDDVAGGGHGFVDAFDLDGNLVRRVASRGRLNSPWGLAIAPAGFGKFGGMLLVGNFGDGGINAFDLGNDRGNGAARLGGQLMSADGRPLTIDGLWALAFGNGGNAGPTSTLFFTAGPAGEAHGLFGTLVPAPAPGPKP